MVTGPGLDDVRTSRWRSRRREDRRRAYWMEYVPAGAVSSVMASGAICVAQ